MKIAQFKNVEHDYTVYWDETMDGVSGYVRLTEYVNIDFPPLPPEDYVGKQLEALDKKRAEIADEFGRKLAEIDNRKRDLLALTHTAVRDTDAPDFSEVGE